MGEPREKYWTRSSCGRVYDVDGWRGLKAGWHSRSNDEMGFGLTGGQDACLRPTILHLLGMDHKKPTYRFQVGRDFRLTDVQWRSGKRHHCLT
ncbi:MAG: hypothetical protein U0936_03640 [Planctomycetaceae bacterium]